MPIENPPAREYKDSHAWPPHIEHTPSSSDIRKHPEHRAMPQVWPKLFETFLDDQPGAASWLLSSSAENGPPPGTLVPDINPPGLRIQLHDPVPVVLSNSRNAQYLDTRTTGPFFENGSDYVIFQLSQTGNIATGVLLGHVIPPAAKRRDVRMTKWAADTRYSVLFKTTWFVDGGFSAAVLRCEDPAIWIEETCAFQSVDSPLHGHRAPEVVRFFDRQDCPSCSQETIVCEHHPLPTSLEGVFDGKRLQDYTGALDSSVNYLAGFAQARMGQYFCYSETLTANESLRAFMRKFISPLSIEEEQNSDYTSELAASWVTASDESVTETNSPCTCVSTGTPAPP